MKSEQLMINCDMGESFGSWKMGADAFVMPWIDMANIACGFHASDPYVMSETIKLAVENSVMIGAHPGYQDLQGFGRRSIAHTPEEIIQMCVYQIGALISLCHLYGTEVKYVKPHGALYNDMMKDPVIFEALTSACEHFSLPLMILSSGENNRYLELADRKNVPLLFEAFADRTYTNEGLLTPRTMPGSVLTNSDDIYHQVMQLAKFQSVTSIDGQKIPIQADTICIHGDNEHSIAVAQRLHDAINAL
ncbi:LamB/YcsF family protein [Vibrio sp. JC009]|uniref:5-oxoprolinase subunit PxpA n=1 Tax=Vibrio sp. JC009 TaxID=2912314 RepID=UPI0023AF2BC4|nr:5-oxoprolinase subunit PxpA [Vibrio sp. JC009]WED24383.1 LamB/YcsF family protein [Vibrio sp. JC009]